MKILIKLGGTLLDSAESRGRLTREITAISKRAEIVVVHGGGKQMTRFLAERGIESRFINGLRVTTPEIIDAVVKVFAGSVNSELVCAFRAAGANPVGLSGLSAALVDAVPLNAELGFVGRPTHSDSRLLELLVKESYLPVIACVAGDSKGQIFNINGDQMAVACAQSFEANRLIFLTDVEGVKDKNGRVRDRLTVVDALDLINEGTATGGMQAKLEAAMTALKQGVGEVWIAPGSVPRVIENILDRIQTGTRLVLE